MSHIAAHLIFLFNISFRRWMVYTLNWGVLSTISTRTDTAHSLRHAPFGNIYSFSDGDCDTSSSSGIPYLYITDLDQSMKDIYENPTISLTLTEAALSESSCTPEGFTDPENPPCARLVITGTFSKVTSETELKFAKNAIFSRHPAMQYWPHDHEFFVGKLEIEDLWMLDWFGGASILDVDEYFEADLKVLEIEKEKGWWEWSDVAPLIRLGMAK